jgi:hypothetical protein
MESMKFIVCLSHLFVLPLLIAAESRAQSMGNISQPAIAAAEGINIKQVASGKVIHRFFDTSPVSPSGRYIGLFRMPYESKSPQPADAGEVVVIELKTGKEIFVTQSRGWEVQLGANVQWGGSDKELLFNDVDTATWKAFCKVVNPFTGASRQLEGTMFMASNDGKRIASYDLIKSTYAQVGYGVVIPKKLIRRNIGPVDTDGIDITDVASGKSNRIVTLKGIYEKSVPSIAISNPQDYEYYCFQVKWNPQGTRLLTTVQWAPVKGGARLRSVITMNADGSNIKTAVARNNGQKAGTTLTGCQTENIFP